jgi:hypothetical protein
MAFELYKIVSVIFGDTPYMYRLYQPLMSVEAYQFAIFGFSYPEHAVLFSVQVREARLR